MKAVQLKSEPWFWRETYHVSFNFRNLISFLWLSYDQIIVTTDWNEIIKIEKYKNDLWKLDLNDIS